MNKLKGIPTVAGIYTFRKDGKDRKVELKMCRFAMGQELYTLRTVGEPGGKMWNNLEHEKYRDEYSGGEWLDG